MNAVDPETNKFLHARLFQTRTTQLTVLSLREIRKKQQVEQATFLVDKAHNLKAALEHPDSDFRQHITEIGMPSNVCSAR
ncbi:hypothetical protein SAMN05216218_12117 [Halorientalis regularis]|uniref:Uncharacterized protein n=1 Tax=Halorientalis regularis TaxID=660518 RepID=A0A1G7SYV9_9EURY|nr:hypothetical protein SAMN05216218_12117 [Halorientalis regularis]